MHTLQVPIVKANIHYGAQSCPDCERIPQHLRPFTKDDETTNLYWCEHCQLLFGVVDEY